jgi:hypothetical protein
MGILAALVIILMVLSYILDDKLRVFYFVLSVLVLFYLADLRIDSLRLSSKKDIKFFFTLSLILTSILSVKFADLFAVLQLLSVVQAYVLRLLFVRQRRDDLFRLRYKISQQTTKLKATTSHLTYSKAKIIQSLFFDLFVLEETNRVTYNVILDIHESADCFLIDVETYLQHPVAFLQKDPRIERKFAAKLEFLNQYLQYHLEQSYQQHFHPVQQPTSQW